MDWYQHRVKQHYMWYGGTVLQTLALPFFAQRRLWLFQQDNVRPHVTRLWTFYTSHTLVPYHGHRSSVPYKLDRTRVGGTLKARLLEACASWRSSTDRSHITLRVASNFAIHQSTVCPIDESLYPGTRSTHQILKLA